MRTLQKIHIQNFKSIRNQSLALNRLNIFIGANGAGKSNLVEVFRLLHEIVAQNLATYSLQRGADRLLHFGRRGSSYISIEIEYGENDQNDGYRIRLRPTDDGSLVVDHEDVYAHPDVGLSKWKEVAINRGSKEANLVSSKETMARTISADLDSYRLYHFHDTSESAAIKSQVEIEDNRFLRPDASNLAAYLYFLQQKHAEQFRNIEDTVRQIAPFFERFNLAPSRLSPDRIRLEWKQQGSDAYFDAFSLSDGTLRFICLATLLLQPELPRMVLLDEPELGLHPAAIHLLAGMLSSASVRTQILVATQSVTLINQFEPESIWTVERDDGQSVFRHLSSQDLSQWLARYGDVEGYGLGELWEKNILGARP